MVRPMNAFCCGCSLRFGAMVILILNLLQNSFYIATTISNIIFKIPTIGFGVNLGMQTFNAMFCLLGLPFIFGGIWGVINRLESYINLYLVYLVVSFVLDVIFIVGYLAFQDICTSTPKALAQQGSAFACGFMRMFSFVFLGSVFVVESYFVFTIWSLCEDLRLGGSGGGLSGLLRGAQDAKMNQQYHVSYTDPLYGKASQASYRYATYNTAGLGGSTRIGGTYHETDYPPVSYS